MLTMKMTVAHPVKCYVINLKLYEYDGQSQKHIVLHTIHPSCVNK